MQGCPADHEGGCDRKPLVESQIRTWNVNEVTPVLKAACSFKEHLAYLSRTATDLNPALHSGILLRGRHQSLILDTISGCAGQI
jgi:hypothetical protein